MAWDRDQNDIRNFSISSSEGYKKEVLAKLTKFTRLKSILKILLEHIIHKELLSDHLKTFPNVT